MFLSLIGSFLIYEWLIFIFDHFTHSCCKFHDCFLVNLFNKWVVSIHKAGFRDLGVLFSSHGEIILSESNPN